MKSVSPRPQMASENHTARHYWRQSDTVGVITASTTNKFRFTKLADTLTSIPAGRGDFLNFGLGQPSISQNQVVFWGAGQAGQSGIYLADAQGLRVLVNSYKTLPDDIQRFACFGSSPVFDQDDILFLGQDQTGRLRIYRDTRYCLIPLVNTGSAVLEEGVGFINLSNPVAQAGTLVFLARMAAGHGKGIFRYTQGQLQTVALTGETDLSLWNLSLPAIDRAGAITFKGETDQYQVGLYRCHGQQIQLIVSTATPIPGGIGSFTALSDPLISQGKVIFRGSGSVFQQGLYQCDERGVQTIVDSQTRIPDSLETFSKFQAFAVDQDQIAFLAQDSYARFGLFLASQGTCLKVIEIGDKLDDKPIVGLSIGRAALHQQALTFRARFVDRTEGIFKVEWPP